MKTNTSTAILTLAVASLLLSACGGDEPRVEPQPETAFDLTTAVAEERQVVDSIEASGVVEAWRRVSPGTKVMGRIEEVRVREADRVRSGQLLAKLEDRDLRAAVDQARAGIAMAEAQGANAEAQYVRMVELESRGSATIKNLEDAVAARDLARASVAKAMADLAAAEAMLAYAEVRSPIDGWVVSRTVERGDMAVPGQAFFTIEDLGRVKVVVRVPETDVLGLTAGKPAEAEIDVLGEVFAVTIDRVVPSGDPASRTFAVELVLDNSDGRIKSGMFARARFARGERLAVSLPESALVRRGQLEGVFVVTDGRVALRWVKTGRADDGRVEVLSGLDSGERYVVSPPPGLHDGSLVREGSGA
jgi:RND family efflux transporter MFP subunit